MIGLLALAGLWVLYILGLGIYRVYLSPLAAFPGPKLAALTLWYEFYYDVFLPGQYMFHIRDLHEKHGPIIRINPYELHISDPEYYDTLYANGAKRDKWGWFTKQFGTPDAMFSTNSHDLHKVRRAALSRFFSKASVRRLMPLVEANMDRLMGRFRKEQELKTVMPLEYALTAFTNDIAMEYAYGQSQDRLSKDDYGPEYYHAATGAGYLGNLMKQFIFIYHFMNSIPVWVQEKISPNMGLVYSVYRMVEGIINRIKTEAKSGYQHSDHPTLFHEILNSNLPESDKSTQRLKDEALIVVGAGTLTSSWALCVAIVHLLSAPEVLSKLKKELRENFPDRNTRMPTPQLEGLPYLTGVIQETLRISNGVATRLQRISPDEPLVFTDRTSHKQWVIPAGTPVSMTGALLHHDETIFPNSHEFRPERWLENPRLDHYLFAFSKGSRQCLGINLAYAEIYLCLATIFRFFGGVCTDRLGNQHFVHDEGDVGVLELYQTTLRDIKIVGDGFIPLREKDSKGINIRIH